MEDLLNVIEKQISKLEKIECINIEQMISRAETINNLAKTIVEIKKNTAIM